MAYINAPPIYRDGFVFVNNDIYVEFPDQSRHRRQTPRAIEAYFDSGSYKHAPLQWFEAQLIHYGLEPAKDREEARKRLFNAVKYERMSVPKHIDKLESEMRNEWIKAARAYKGDALDLTRGRWTKRAADDDGEGGASKKAKPGPSDDTEPMTAASAGVAPSLWDFAMPKVAADENALASKAAPPNDTTERQTPVVAAAAQPEPVATPSEPGHRAFNFGSAVALDNNGAGYNYSHVGRDNTVDSEPLPALEPLGMLEGHYTLDSPDIESIFDFGRVSGVLVLAYRPLVPSHDLIGFRWRGRDNGGDEDLLLGREGWMMFPGGGRVEGQLTDFELVGFSGVRDADQATTRQVTASDLVSEWEEYDPLPRDEDAPSCSCSECDEEADDPENADWD